MKADVVPIKINTGALLPTKVFTGTKGFRIADMSVSKLLKLNDTEYMMLNSYDEEINPNVMPVLKIDGKALHDSQYANAEMLSPILRIDGSWEDKVILKSTPRHNQVKPLILQPVIDHWGFEAVTFNNGRLVPTATFGEHDLYSDSADDTSLGDYKCMSTNVTGTGKCALRISGSAYLVDWIPITVVFDLDLGQVISINRSGVFAGMIRTVGGYRCWMSAPGIAAVSSTTYPVVAFVDNVGQLSFMGDETASIVFNSVQFEDGQAPGRYIIDTQTDFALGYVDTKGSMTFSLAEPLYSGGSLSWANSLDHCAIEELDNLNFKLTQLYYSRNNSRIVFNNPVTSIITIG